jgi:imidazolonepropionase
MSDVLILGIGELVTNDPDRAGLLGIVEDAVIAVLQGRVAWTGSRNMLPREYRDLPTYDVEGRAVIPGFVDSHTHLVFAGDRSDEFGRRLAGETYEQIMASGGGIRATVEATRSAGMPELMDQSLRRAGRMLAHGTTTVEIKSGYGLRKDVELRQLDVAKVIGEELAIDVVRTFLGAHVVPAEFENDRDGYVDLVIDDMLPAASLRASFCDVFCDEGAFTVDEARRILNAASELQMRPRLHANQLGHTGGAALAAELGAVSADHLDHVTAHDMASLADAGTVAVVFPSVSLSMRTPPPPARALWDAGVTVAVATDCNPGTSYVESMQFVTALASLTCGLTPEEALWSATRGGAMALDIPDKGSLATGAVADLVVLDAASHVEIPYRPGINLAHRVIKDGEVLPPG